MLRAAALYYSTVLRHVPLYFFWAEILPSNFVTPGGKCHIGV